MVATATVVHLGYARRRGLSDLPQMRLPHFDDEKYFDVYMNYTICVEDRDDMVQYLKDSGVEVLTPISLAKPLHHQPALGLQQYDLPNTERIARQFIYLPAHPEMSDEQVDYVIQTIRNYYQ